MKSRFSCIGRGASGASKLKTRILIVCYDLHLEYPGSVCDLQRASQYVGFSYFTF
jgi:hypothetical protein